MILASEQVGYDKRSAGVPAVMKWYACAALVIPYTY
jgi:hypothetical protein